MQNGTTTYLTSKASLNGHSNQRIENGNVQKEQSNKGGEGRIRTRAQARKDQKVRKDM